MSIGEQLRNARLERGLSLEDIARQTFIRINHLEGIERGDYSSIPPSRLPYFVRDFARHVGLNPDELVAGLPDTSAPMPAPSTSSEAKPSRPSKPERKEKEPKEETTTSDRPQTAFGDEGEESVRTVTFPEPVVDRPKRRRPRYGPIDQGNPVLARALMMVAGVLLIGLGIYYLAGGFDDADDSLVPPPAGDTASPTRILSRPDGLEDAEGEEVYSGDSIVLEGRFTDRVWYNIKMDDQREDEGILDSGEVRTWKAMEKFSVSLGNAGGVEFTLNGKSIGTLAPLGRSIRGKILTVGGAEGGQASSSTTATPSSTQTQPRRRSSSSRRSRRNQQEGNEEGGIQRPEPAQTAPRNVVEPE